MAQTIIVDISTRGANPVAYTHQGDTGRTFFAEIYENGEAFAVAGYTIKVGAILPADRGYTVIAGNDMVTATKTNDNTTNKIYFTLSNKYSLKAGNGILTLIFTSNTGTPSTIRPINIDLRIQKSADADDTIAGASDFPEGLEAIAEDVFQEYLSTYLPPVAPSASAAANKAADAKLTGEALDDLKSELQGAVLGNTVKNALLRCFQKVAWLDETGKDAYNYLAALFSEQVCIINYNLVNCTCDNNAETCTRGQSYTATISTVSADALKSASITVRMGGRNITSSVYSNGHIQIPQVTGNVTITAILAEGYIIKDFIGISASPPEEGIIFTGIALSSNYTLKTKLWYRQNGSSPYPILGTRNGYGAKEVALFITPTTGKLGYWWDNDDTLTDIFASNNIVNDIKITPVGKSSSYPNNMTITINGTEYNSGSSKSGTVFNPWFGLFGYCRSATDGNSIGANIGAKIGETVVIDENGNTIHDLIPASNGTYVGMIDAKTGTFYANESYNSYYSLGNWSEVIS